MSTNQGNREYWDDWFVVYEDGRREGPYRIKADAVMAQGWNSVKRSTNRGLYESPDGTATLGRKRRLICFGFDRAFGW